MKCKICGKEEHPENYINKKDMERNQMCFTCNFWKERLKEDGKLPPHKAVVIDGTHYIIEGENSRSYFRGFGGARFQIEFFDGTKVITTNLWCQGDIPSEWKNKFPDNAKFENNLKWTKIGEVEYLIEEENVPF